MPILPYDDRIVGTSGYIWYGEPPLPPDDLDIFFGIGPQFTSETGQAIPITSWSMEIDKHLKDMTNSTNYDPGTGVVYPVDAVTSIRVSAQISGRFRLSVVPVTILKDLFSDRGRPLITFALNPYIQFGSGYFVIRNFRITNPIDDVVNFSCDVKGQGVFTPLTGTPSLPDPVAF